MANKDVCFNGVQQEQKENAVTDPGHFTVMKLIRTCDVIRAQFVAYRYTMIDIVSM